MKNKNKILIGLISVVLFLNFCFPINVRAAITVEDIRNSWFQYLIPNIGPGLAAVDLWSWLSVPDDVVRNDESRIIQYNKWITELESKQPLTKEQEEFLNTAKREKEAIEKSPSGKYVGELEAIDIIINLLAYILYIIFAALGWIITRLMWAMLTVMSYPINVNNTAAVVEGWKVVRNLFNNFFIVLLMVVAIGTILNKKDYHYKAMLPKILIAAILINFSKLFVGIAIDISQVLMLSFASAFANIQGGNIVLSALKLPELTRWQEWTANPMNEGISKNKAGIEMTNIFAALIYAIIVAVIVVIVIVSIIAILVARIVVLLFLTILSPAYVFLKLIKQTEKYSSDWFNNFVKYLTVGPVLVFFLWISFMMMGHGGNSAERALNNNPTRDIRSSLGGQVPDKQEITDLNKGTLSAGLTVEGIINTALVIGALIVCLNFAKGSGVVGANVANSGMSWLQQQAKKPMKFGKSLAKSGLGAGAWVGKKAAGKAGTGSLALASGISKGLGKLSGSEGLTKLGAFGSQWRTDVLEGRRKVRKEKLSKAMGKMGLGSDKAKAAWGEFTNTDLAKNVKAGALAVTATVGTVAGGVATGGLGLGALAVGYMTGGGRLLEMALGDQSSKRQKNREEEGKKIDEASQNTKNIVATSEKGRDLAIDQRIKSDPAYAARVKAEGEISQIDNVQSGKISKGMVPSDFLDFLNGRGAYRSMSSVVKKGKVSDADLAKAKEDFHKETAYTDRQNKIETHKINSETIRADEESRHVTRVEDSLNASKSGKTAKEQERIEAEKNRFLKEYQANIDLNSAKGAIQGKLDLELAAINARTYGLSSISDIENRREQERKKAYENKDSEDTKANEKYTDTIGSVQPQKPQPNLVDTVLDDYKPYAHENWVSQAVAEDATKMKKAIDNLIKVIENGATDADFLTDISRGSFYSTNGQTEMQFKSVKALTESTGAIKTLTDSLAALPRELSGPQAYLVLELKRGIAAYEKGGGDVSKLSTVIALLNEKVGRKTENGPIIDNKTVAEHGSNVIPKK